MAQYAAVRFENPLARNKRGPREWFDINQPVPDEVAKLVDDRVLVKHKTKETEGYSSGLDDMAVASWIVEGSSEAKRAERAKHVHTVEQQREAPRRNVLSYAAEVFEAETGKDIVTGDSLTGPADAGDGK